MFEKMLKQVVFFVLTFVCLTYGCSTVADITSVTNSRNSLTTIVNVVVNNVNTSDPDRPYIYAQVMETICNQSETGIGRLAIKNIAEKLKACPALASSISAEQQDGINLSDVIKTFMHSLDNICMCPGSVVCATKVRLADKKQMTNSITVPEVGNVQQLCGLKNDFMCTEMYATTSCRNLAMYTGLTDMSQFNMIRGFTELQCDKYTIADWTCARTRASGSGFDDCVAYSRGQKMGQDCGVLRCVNDYIYNTCGQNATEVFIAAANIFSTKEKIRDATCGASSLQMSVFAFVAIISFYKSLL